MIFFFTYDISFLEKIEYTIVLEESHRHRSSAAPLCRAGFMPGLGEPELDAIITIYGGIILC